MKSKLAGVFCLLAVFCQPVWGQRMGTRPRSPEEGPAPTRAGTAYTPVIDSDGRPRYPQPPRIPRPPMITSESGPMSDNVAPAGRPSRSIVSVPSVGKNRSVPIEVIRGSGAPAPAARPKASGPSRSSLADEALKQIQAAQSVDELTPFLDHPLPTAQAQAIESLLERGPEGRLALITAAQSSRVRTKVTALWGLGMNEPSLSEIELIVEAIRDRNEEVQKVAIQMAGRLGPQASTMAQAALLEALESDSTEIRTAASAAAARLSTDVVPDLVGLLGARREVVRDAAGRTLIRIGAPAVTPLIEQLKDPRPTVRYWAVYALGEIGTPALEALPLIESMAKSDPDSTVKFYAQAAVRRLTR